AHRLRLFVYSPPPHAAWSDANLSNRFPKCKRFQWSGDWELIQRVRASQMLTTHGERADFYLVPFLAKCYFNHVAHYRLRAMDDALSQASCAGEGRGTTLSHKALRSEAARTSVEHTSTPWHALSCTPDKPPQVQLHT
ncbi:MAG: hypothetical protein SGPRY_013320, partial [Prymnesium sp.]